LSKALVVGNWGFLLGASFRPGPTRIRPDPDGNNIGLMSEVLVSQPPSGS
jgi:hypothetical protein